MPLCREDRCSNKSPTRTGTGSSNEQVEKLLANASTETFTMVARGALDDASVTLVGKPKFAEITTGHNDKRTIGIVKVIGSAMVGVGEKTVEWSSIAKIVDMSVDITGADAARWVSPRIEQLVYETRLFEGENMPFRSARCYLSDSSNDQLIVLWLEDLSDAPQPPWELENFIIAANHLGQVNGELAIRPIELPFEMLEDGFQVRCGSQDYGAIAEQMLEARYSSVTQQAYSQAPVDAGIKLATCPTGTRTDQIAAA